MKNFKLFAFAVVAAFALTACNSVEKVLPKKDGRWQTTRAEVKVYTDGTLTQDTVYTDFDGFSVFNSDGTGYSEDNNKTKVDGSDFTWSVDGDNITITQDSTSTTSTVLESKKDSQRWSTTTEFDILGITIRTESISESARVSD